MGLEESARPGCIGFVAGPCFLDKGKYQAGVFPPKEATLEAALRYPDDLEVALLNSLDPKEQARLKTASHRQGALEG